MQLVAASRLYRSILLLLLVGLVGSVTACGAGVTPIENVKAKWRRHSTVLVQGNVVNQVKLLDSWVYEVEDSTGAIWVLTKRPSQPGQVQIKGKVRYEAISIEGQDFGEAYLVENSRSRTPPAPATASP